MADVTVEFGAKDVGLEKTLKTIQEEMLALQSKVKSGDLSITELEQTMRRLGKVESMEKRLKSIGDYSDESSQKVQKLSGVLDGEFQKIAGAFTVGNLAAQGFQKIIDVAFNAARAVAQGFSDALDLGGRLNELSSRTGETAGKLLVLETAFKNSGLEAAQVGTAINKLQNFMQDAANGGDKQRAAMQNLGISMADLAGKTPTEQMKIFADRISGIEDPTQRAAAASEVFGDKLGGKLLPLFNDFSGNLDDARSKVGSLEQVMDDNAATFDAAAETIDAVKGKMAAFTAGVLSETIPAVKKLGQEMEQVDAAGFGKAVGTLAAPAIQSFTRDIQILIDVLGGFKKVFTDFSTGIVGGAENFKKLSEEANNYLQVLAALLPGGLNPVNLAVKGLASVSREAVAETKEIATASDNAAGTVAALGKSAETTGENIASAFTINSDFKPTVDGIASGWSDLNSQITGTEPLLSSNLSLADSMVGKIKEQRQSIGGVNEQLDLSNKLSQLASKTTEDQAKKLKEKADKEAERQSALRENLELDLQILKAQISGNDEEVKALNYQKDYNAALKQAIDAGMGKSEAEAFADQIARARQEQAGMNKELSESAKLLKSISDAEAKDAVDKGGRLQKKAQDQTARGDFSGARKTADKIAENEAKAAITGVGANRDRRDMADIGKDYGLNRGLGESTSGFRERIRSAREDGVFKDFSKLDKPASGLEAMKSQGSLKDDLAARRAGVDKPGQDGQKPPDKDSPVAKKGLDGLVNEILKLVQKIEPRLPVAALV